MSLAREFHSKYLGTDDINRAFRNHDVEEITQFIRSSENFVEFLLICPPVNEEFGRQISDAIVQNFHIRKLYFDEHWAIRDLVAWIRSRNTLVNMKSLESVLLFAHDDMSALDFSALCPLLLSSTSLHSFEIEITKGNNGWTDDVMRALSSYLGSASLTRFEFRTSRLSEAAFAALCNGVALSTVQQFTVCKNLFRECDLETRAESFARMIVESSLEEATIDRSESAWSKSFISALKLTTPVRNMDFAFTHTGDNFFDHETRLRINRKWKPLIIGANTPLALWPLILEKSHTSSETSHGSADIVFYALRQKPDLVPVPHSKSNCRDCSTKELVGCTLF